MNINKRHVHSNVQTRDKSFSMIFKMIRPCITVLRQNVNLRQLHLSKRYLKLQNTYVLLEFECDIIKILVCPKAKEHPQRHLQAVKVSKNDVIT